MNILKVRSEMGKGRSIFDLPLRVTFYARVSTDKTQQLNSLENQVQHYTELIQSKPSWTYIPGYIDEGISGTSTKNRDSFLRMIRDAKAGRFDFIITKEISRFSRSTLDSIQYTQELLEHDVGVLFQNDNINTMDPDSEFRLTIMAGVAQDEVRKLSERLKFGFHQAIKNGHVLGNDKLWGYDKKDCVLTVNQREAAIVRRIFDLYANQGLGIRKISQQLYKEGCTSRRGNAFNEVTIRHMLCNPKYKGWYCAGKSQTVDYRTKRRVFLDEEDWVLYPDPAVPAIVSEELWDRANALYRLRSKQIKAHQQAADYHSRYSYSGKILCEAHNTSYHRRLRQTRQGGTEVWECKVYHQKGKTGCSSPRLFTWELDRLMASVLSQVLWDREAIVNTVLQVLQAAGKKEDSQTRRNCLTQEKALLQQKKERLLEMNLNGTISLEEFKQWNDQCNAQLQTLLSQEAALQEEEPRKGLTSQNLGEIKKALEEELSFQGRENHGLVGKLLNRIVVKKGSTSEAVRLEISLNTGDVWECVWDRSTASLTGSRF